MDTSLKPWVIWHCAKAILLSETCFVCVDIWTGCTYQSKTNKPPHSHSSLHFNRTYYSLHSSDVFRIHFCHFSSFDLKRFQLAAIPPDPPPPPRTITTILWWLVLAFGAGTTNRLVSDTGLYFLLSFTFSEHLSTLMSKIDVHKPKQQMNTSPAFREGYRRAPFISFDRHLKCISSYRSFHLLQHVGRKEPEISLRLPQPTARSQSPSGRSKVPRLDNLCWFDPVISEADGLSQRMQTVESVQSSFAIETRLMLNITDIMSLLLMVKRWIVPLLNLQPVWVNADAQAT